MKTNTKIIYPLLAKVGHRLDGSRDEQARTLLEHCHDTEIKTYDQIRLSTILDVLDDDSDTNDIVMMTEEKKYGLDYDFKREVLSDGSTRPFKTMDEFKAHRAVMNTLRKKKGIRATPELVNYYANRSKQNVRNRGSSQADCVRHFCRALIQGVHPFNSDVPKYDHIVNRFAYTKVTVTVNSLKNAKRVPFVSNVIFNSTSNRALIRYMLKRMHYESDNNFKDWIDLLVNRGLSNPVTMFMD